MSFLCPSHVFPVSFPCLSCALPMSFPCPFHVIPVSFLRPSHVLPVSFPCSSHVFPMSFPCLSCVLPELQAPAPWCGIIPSRALGLWNSAPGPWGEGCEGDLGLSLNARVPRFVLEPTLPSALPPAPCALPSHPQHGAGHRVGATWAQRRNTSLAFPIDRRHREGLLYCVSQRSALRVHLVGAH